MNDKRKSTDRHEQPVTDVSDERVQAGDARNRWRGGKNAYPGGGMAGPVERNKADYKTHYGEDSYGGGQKHYEGPVPVDDVNAHDDNRPEGKAGSKATVPGAGADRGPPDKS